MSNSLIEKIIKEKWCIPNSSEEFFTHRIQLQYMDDL